MKDTNTGAVKETNKSAIFSWLGTPPAGELIPLSLQHVAAMVIGCVTPAIIIAGVCNLSSSDTVILIQSALLISALITFMQLFPIGNHMIGAGLPVIMGVSFAYLPTLQRYSAPSWSAVLSRLSSDISSSTSDLCSRPS